MIFLADVNSLEAAFWNICRCKSEDWWRSRQNHNNREEIHFLKTFLKSWKNKNVLEMICSSTILNNWVNVFDSKFKNDTQISHLKRNWRKIITKLINQATSRFQGTKIIISVLSLLCRQLCRDSYLITRLLEAVQRRLDGVTSFPRQI